MKTKASLNYYKVKRAIVRLLKKKIRDDGDKFLQVVENLKNYEDDDIDKIIARKSMSVKILIKT